MRISLQIVLLAFFLQCAYSASCANPEECYAEAIQALTLAKEEYFNATEMLKYELNSISEYKRKVLGVEDENQSRAHNDIALTIGGFYQSGDCGTDSIPN